MWDRLSEAVFVVLVAFGLRSVDWWMPKGHHSKHVDKYGEQDEEACDEPE